MEYKFAPDQDFSDYASGRVLYSLPGHPAFPARLASEIFQRCAAVLASQGRMPPYTLYDPCCGAGYALAVIGLLHPEWVSAVVGSDVSQAAVEIAAKNLSLLTPAGRMVRRSELERMLADYGKESHREALVSLNRLENSVKSARLPVTWTFLADAADSQAVRAGLGELAVDLAFTDLPYGVHSAWQGEGGAAWAVMEGLAQVLKPGAVVAIAADKAQKLAHPAYSRVERFQVGKRQVGIMRVGW